MLQSILGSQLTGQLSKYIGIFVFFVIFIVVYRIIRGQSIGKEKKVKKGEEDPNALASDERRGFYHRSSFGSISQHLKTSKTSDYESSVE